MQNTCPQCATVYTVTRDDIGRRIACKNCRIPLLVAEAGLVREGSPARTANPSPAPVPAVRRNAQEEELVDLEMLPLRDSPLRRLRAFFDVPTALFAIGMVLTIVSMFGPLLDRGRVLARQADLAEATSDYARRTEDIKEGAQPKVREEFKIAKDKIAVEIASAKFDAARAQRFDQRGIMLGFVCLGLGCLGWISDPGASPMRHRVATWLLVAMMVLVFLSIAIASIGATKSGLDL